MPDAVDFERLDLFAGTTEARGEFVESFVAHVESELDALATAIAGRDVAVIEQVAHRCGGTTATCGMEPLRFALREIETVARGGAQPAEALLETVRAEFVRVRLALAAWAGSATEAP